jgi:hypothetical protein
MAFVLLQYLGDMPPHARKNSTLSGAYISVMLLMNHV